MKKTAFKNLLQKHQNRVFSYAFYLLKNREDAEDVTQEVFVKLWKNWQQINRTKVEAWLMRVTHNHCIDVMRAAPRKLNQVLWTEEIERKGLLTASHSSTPEQQFAVNETQKSLLSAMSLLPERIQSMMLLHYFQGYKFEMIGEILDVNISTVKVAVHRGRKMLKKEMSKHYPEYAGEYR